MSDGPGTPTDERLGQLRDAAEGGGLFLDFDGTLSFIVDDPAAARPIPGVTEQLARLATRWARVAVVSGRPVDFLRTHLGGLGLLLCGLYGLETATDDRTARDDEVERWRETVGRVTESAQGDAGLAVAGVDIEPKGLSVTLHFRRADRASAETAARDWAGAAAAATGLVVLDARRSVELRPPVGRTKRTAVLAAAGELHSVLFMGDDRGDLEGFDALDDLAAAGVNSVRVGVRSDEAPPELLARADLVVDGPDGALELLKKL
ncbi:MAG: trehalose-phosphatase [Acidimicrobiales bacterium]